MSRQGAIQRVLLVTLGLNAGVAVAKLVVGSMAGSIALWADGLHSTLDGSSNVVALIGIAFAHRPPDDNHPYGHRKFEAMAALAIAAFLFFACFEVLRHRFGKPWWEWPEEWRQPDDARCAALRDGAEADEVAFVEFVQWTADRQLGGAADLARKLGMKVGLYLDVAVGVQADGFDAWNEQAAISRHLGVGAPPDPLNLAGVILPGERVPATSGRTVEIGSTGARVAARA